MPTVIHPALHPVSVARLHFLRRQGASASRVFQRNTRVKPTAANPSESSKTIVFIGNLVDVTGIEPVTACLQRLVARRINDLDGTRSFATECYQVQRPLEVRKGTRRPVSLSKVWWAQNWAQSQGMTFSRRTTVESQADSTSRYGSFAVRIRAGNSESG
jgi:hypothetical protein